MREVAPQVGLEPTTLRLTAECSAIELLRNTLAARKTLRNARTNFITKRCERGQGDVRTASVSIWSAPTCRRFNRRQSSQLWKRAITWRQAGTQSGDKSPHSKLRHLSEKRVPSRR